MSKATDETDKPDNPPPPKPPKNRRRRGRPPGSKNKAYRIVKEIRASCFKCGSTELERIKGATPRIREGIIRTDGTVYNAMSWTRKRCKRCGQVVMVQAGLRK